MVRALHEAGIEVILDVVYNHTAEGNHLGPTLSLPGHRQRGLLPARRGRPALLHGLHRHRQHPERPAPALAAADHGLAALLGDRDARRRLPLRPRRHAGPRVLRRRPAVDLLRARPAGPGRQPGQADRRAVGRRPRRLPGRQLPAAVDGVERQVPRHRARLLARRAGTLGEFAARLTGLGRPLRARPAAARSRPSTSSPRTTASRCATSSPTTRSTTRPTARTTATARATTGRGTAASRARPTTRRSSRCAPRQQRNFLATLLLSPGRADALHGDELGRTQRRQQQRLLPGQRAHLDRLGRRRRAAGRVHRRRSSRLRREHPVFRRRRFFAGRPVRRAATASRCPTSPGSPGRPGDDEDDWDSGFGAVDRRCSSTATASAARPRGERVVDDSFLLCFNAQRRRRARPCRREEYAASGRSSIDTGRHRAPSAAAEPPGDVGRWRAQRAGAPRAHCAAATRSSVAARSPRRRPQRSTSRMRGRPRVRRRRCARPLSTYRLQITAGSTWPRPRTLTYLPTSASTGSTSRRCSRPSPARPRLRRRRPRPRSTRRAAARKALARLSADGARHRAWACSSTSCPTTWASPRRAPTRRGGTCCARARLALRATGSTSTGTPGRPGAAPGRSATTTTPVERELAIVDGRAALLRAPLPARARHGRRRRRTRCTTGSTTSWSTGGAADAEQNYRGSSRSPRWPGCGSRTRRSSTPPTPRSSAGCDEGVRRRAAGRPSGRAARPGGYLDGLRGADRRRLRAGREDPRAGRAAAGRWPVAGTTGYDALAEVDRVFVDPAGRGR